MDQDEEDDGFVGWGLELEVNGTREKRTGVWQKPVKEAENDVTNAADYWKKRRRSQFGVGEQAAWDKFYAEKGIKFFKDRYNLRKFFPELMPESVREQPEQPLPNLTVVKPLDPQNINELPSQEVLDGKTIVVEVGCGVGNACFPLLRANLNMFMYSFDFSKVAIDLLRCNAEYDQTRLYAFVGDVTRDGDIRDVVGSEKADFVTLVWALSALTPESMPDAVQEVRSVLKPGGTVLLRDYAVGDLAQLRKSGNVTRDEVTSTLLRRGDGTIAYFFDKEGVQQLFEAEGFRTVNIQYVERHLENRKQGKEMQRRWIQAKFEKL